VTIDAPPSGSRGECLHVEMLGEHGMVAADICQLRGEPSDLPSVWLIHLPVNDFAESLRRVRQRGGQVIVQNHSAGNAVIRDPVGVYFALQAG
jgi:predicted enzyme related to lactoylglutathione lyase